jgi:hypothetical protein
MANRPGRPKKGEWRENNKIECTDEIIDRVCAAIRMGNYMDIAAKFAGLGKTTLYKWLVSGRRPSGAPQYKKFVEKLEQAMAEWEVRAVTNIAQSTEWTANAWRLERRFPERWGRVDRMKAELTGKDGAPLPVPKIYVLPVVTGSADEETTRPTAQRVTDDLRATAQALPAPTKQ